MAAVEDPIAPAIANHSAVFRMDMMIRPARAPLRLLFWLVLLAPLVVAYSSVQAGAIVGESAELSRRFSYETGWSIATEGMTGKPLVAFQPTTGTASDGQEFALGHFVLGPISDGSTTTYDRTPFAILFRTLTLDGQPILGTDGGPGSALVLQGWISGTASGTGRSHIQIDLDQGIQSTDPQFYQPHPLPPIPASSGVGGGTAMGGSPGSLTLNRSNSWLVVDPNSSDGVTLVASVRLAENTPEPSSIVIMGGLAVLGFARQRRSDDQARSKLTSDH